MVRPLGMSSGGDDENEPSSAEPSPKLLAVIEQLIRDPSKGPELAAKLQREDLALLAELLQWLQSQQ